MKFLYLIPVIVLTACAGEPAGPVFDPSIGARPDNATVVVYRPKRSYVDQGLAEVKINNGSECKMRNSGYLLTKDVRGEINIEAAVWSEPGTSRLKLGTKPGEIYYLRLDAKPERLGAALFAGFVGMLAEEGMSSSGGPFTFTQIAQPQAIKELRGMKQDCID